MAYENTKAALAAIRKLDGDEDATLILAESMLRDADELDERAETLRQEAAIAAGKLVYLAREKWTRAESRAAGMPANWA